MATKHEERLIVALQLALDEIHNPGAASNAGIDIVALCEGVLKAATKFRPGALKMIRDEIMRLTREAAAHA